jgi:hypothetical protein
MTPLWDACGLWFTFHSHATQYLVSAEAPACLYPLFTRM